MTSWHRHSHPWYQRLNSLSPSLSERQAVVVVMAVHQCLVCHFSWSRQLTPSITRGHAPCGRRPTKFLQFMQIVLFPDVRRHKICYSFWGTKSLRPPGLRLWTHRGTCFRRTSDLGSPFLNSKYATDRRSGVAMAMHHRLTRLSTCRLKASVWKLSISSTLF